MALLQAAEHTQGVQLVTFTRLTPRQQHEPGEYEQLKLYHCPVQNHQEQGTRDSPMFTNVFCSAMLDESCFQAPLLTLPGNNTLKDLRASGEHLKSKPVCGITPLLSRPALQEAGWEAWVCFMVSTQKTPSRSSRNFHSLLQNTIGVYWKVMGDG